jgi:hypothetical protein
MLSLDTNSIVNTTGNRNNPEITQAINSIPYLYSNKLTNNILLMESTNSLDLITSGRNNIDRI